MQKEELEREFVVEREELEADYQKQVDDTFIFGYRCCMKKNGIKRDVPSIPPGEEKKLQGCSLIAFDFLQLFAVIFFLYFLRSGDLFVHTFIYINKTVLFPFALVFAFSLIILF